MSPGEESQVWAACQLLELAVNLLGEAWPDDWAGMPQATLIRERNTDAARLSVLIQAALKEIGPLHSDKP